MAFNATALKGHTLHTPRGFLVFNEGKETLAIPDEYRGRLENLGVIPREGEDGGAEERPARARAPARKAAGRKAAAKGGGADVTADFDAGAFTVAKGQGIGMYEISGGDLAKAVSVKGKAATQKRLDALNKAGGSSDAPTD